jgi:hypothetical protein
MALLKKARSAANLSHHLTFSLSYLLSFQRDIPSKKKEEKKRRREETKKRSGSCALRAFF